ncbi:autotransporter assembly complex family protein [Sphingomonas sp. MMS24-J13]|uniref:autotransporter assembly complex protein TamA n=1 Tax=Sphingomonas sp. MMS24-J13 TaxID=3238686 RepID=UPI00384FF844
MVPGSQRPAALSIVAAALLLLPPALAHGQTAAPGVDAGPSPDPNSGLAPLPDLGVDWPDPARIDAARPGDVQGGANKGVTADRLQRYHVVVEGAESVGDTFAASFKQLSALVANEGKPANAAQIDRRARDDEALIAELLRAAGRYDGRVVSNVSVGPDGGETIVRLSVTPGETYHFGEVTLPGLDAAGPRAKTLRDAFAVKAGDAVDAATVNAAIAAFKVSLGRDGYPFARVTDPDITVDHATRKAVLALAVDPGARAKFGHVTAVGAHPIFTAQHLARIARFRTGDEYDAALLDDFRRALIATGLVSLATITPTPTADPGVVDIAVKIDRAPPRTIAGELGYGTGEGARAEISWQHRNLLPPEGAVTFRGVAGTSEQSLGATLRMSNVQARDRVLTAQIVASHTNFDAYDARTFTILGTIERQTNIIWQKKWTWSVGAEFVASDERDTIEATGAPRRRTFLVAAIPTGLSYDGSDDLLNPTRGFRLSGRFSPELSLQLGAHVYVRLQIDASGYQPIGDRVVLAGRLRLGSIDGVARDSIAPSRRFYSGGGGSVRGYGYQKIGPVDVNGDPIGGKALTEFGAEARIRFGTFGIVPFLDGGNLYAGSVPKFQQLRFGTGLGVRYYSSFGPIRVDVGTPLDRRPGESRVAVYVSLGQAF